MQILKILFLYTFSFSVIMMLGAKVFAPLVSYNKIILKLKLKGLNNIWNI